MRPVWERAQQRAAAEESSGHPWADRHDQNPTDSSESTRYVVPEGPIPARSSRKKSAEQRAGGKKVQSEGRLVSEKGASDFLGLPITATRRLRQDGELEVVKLGRRYYYDRRDLDRWVEERKERCPVY